MPIMETTASDIGFFLEVLASRAARTILEVQSADNYERLIVKTNKDIRQDKRNTA